MKTPRDTKMTEATRTGNVAILQNPTEISKGHDGRTQRPMGDGGLRWDSVPLNKIPLRLVRARWPNSAPYGRRRPALGLGATQQNPTEISKGTMSSSMPNSAPYGMASTATCMGLIAIQPNPTETRKGHDGRT